MSLEAIKHLKASTGNFETEVFVVDNASKDDSVEAIKKAHPDIKILQNKSNVGFGRANNQVLNMLKGDYVLLLNTDAFVLPDTLYKTLQYMQAQSKCGVLGVKLLGSDGALQPSCRYFPTPFNIFAARVGLNRLFPAIKLVDDDNWNPDLTQNCDWVPGCYYLIRKKVIEQVGLFDPLYFLYCEEVDHCFAVKKAGWDVTYFADTSVVHIGGESAKSDNKIESKNRQINSLRIESELLYFRKNHGLFGLGSYLLLTLSADCYDILKFCLRFQFSRISFNLNCLVLTWQVLFRTRFATVSTR